MSSWKRLKNTHTWTWSKWGRWAPVQRCWARPQCTRRGRGRPGAPRPPQAPAAGRVGRRRPSGETRRSGPARRCPKSASVLPWTSPALKWEFGRALIGESLDQKLLYVLVYFAVEKLLDASNRSMLIKMPAPVDQTFHWPLYLWNYLPLLHTNHSTLKTRVFITTS